MDVGNIILVGVTAFILLGVYVCNKLIDRTEIKQKDKTIQKLGNALTEAVTKQKVSEKSEQTARTVSDKTGELASKRVENAERFSSLAEQAKHVVNEQDAIDLARRQVEENR